MKKFIKCLYKAAAKTIYDDGVEHAGYMAFMVVLSLFPFLVFILALTSFFGASELGQAFTQLIIDNMPDNVTDSLAVRIYELKKAPPANLMNLAIFGTIWTASSFVEGLRTILNRINEVSSPPAYIWRRLLSIIQFIIISISVSIAMLLLVIIPMGLSKFPELISLNSSWHYSRYPLIFMSLFLTVCSLYYFIPNIKMRFSKILPGALITVILWLISGYLLSIYLNNYNQFSLIYGSLGGIIATLLFFYITNMFFIYGAAFNYWYNKG